MISRLIDLAIAAIAWWFYQSVTRETAIFGAVVVALLIAGEAVIKLNAIVDWLGTIARALVVVAKKEETK